jgi:hypothetical protein
MILQIGDSIAIATLAAKAWKALSSSQGSKAEFKSLITALKALGNAMIQAEAVCMEYHTSYISDTHQDPRRLIVLDSIARDIAKENSECKALVSQFLEVFESYTKAFTDPDKGKMYQGYKSLTLLFRKDELARVEKRLNEHLQAMQLLFYSYHL